MDWANSMHVADGKFIPNFVGIPKIKREILQTRVLERG
jgi:hypothetical protein